MAYAAERGGTLGEKNAPADQGVSGFSARAPNDLSGSFSLVNWCRRKLGRRRSGICPAFAHLEAGKPADSDIFAEFGDRLVDHFADRLGLVLDEMLFVE